MRSPKSNYTFSVAPSVEMPRSSFRRDRTYKTTFDSGYLVPFYVDEVYPGDTFNVGVTAFARLATPAVPFMDNLYMDFFFFYVPYRLLWSHWVNMCGEQDNPDDSTDYLTPVLSGFSGGASEGDVIFYTGDLGDYFGLPVDVNLKADPPTVWPFRAYNKIWNDHFRDENLQDSVYFDTGDGPDALDNFNLLRRGKRPDYFAGCLPWPQKGPGAEIPLGTMCPVYGDGTALRLTDGTNSFALKNYANNSQYIAVSQSLNPSTAAVDAGDTTLTNAAHAGAYGVAGVNLSDENGSVGLYADLSEANAITINSLRTAFQVQKWYEKLARGGSRYGELVYQMFGVRNPDSRLQRSEFLGGGQIPVQIHSVAQTSSSDDVTPQGNLAAYGVAGGRVGFSKSFVEHGLVMGLVEVRADITYQQGIERWLSRRTKFDYYWPSFAHLGEQAVLNKEIFATGNATVDNGVFGYQERWAELRYGISKITGKLRSGVSGSLDVWHLSQQFEDTPRLSADFIVDDPPVSRVVAVQDEPQFIFDSLISCNCVRPLPVYSIPGLIDHF